MKRLARLLAVLASFGASAAQWNLTGGALSVTIAPDGGWHLAVDGTSWWASPRAGYALKADGTWYVSGSSLSLESAKARQGSDVMGRFDAVSLAFRGAPVPMMVEWRAYATALVVEQSFGAGWSPSAETSPPLALTHHPPNLLLGSALLCALAIEL